MKHGPLEDVFPIENWDIPLPEGMLKKIMEDDLYPVSLPYHPRKKSPPNSIPFDKPSHMLGSPFTPDPSHYQYYDIFLGSGNPT